MRLNIKRLVCLLALVASPLTLPLGNSQGTEGRVLTIEEIEDRYFSFYKESDQARSALTRLRELQTGEPLTKIESIRQWANSYVENLPDFVCTQFNQDFILDGMGHWRKTREAVATVRFVDGKESYKTVNLNGVPSDEDWMKASSGRFGHFGSLLKEMFAAGSPASFVYLGEEPLNGQTVDVFSVTHPKGYTLHKGVKRNGKLRKPIVVGYEGKIYVAKHLHLVIRIAFERFVGIPRKYPYSGGSLQTDFSFVPIGEKMYWLPVEYTGVIEAKQGTKYALKSQYHTIWVDYKRFGAETRLTFD